MRKTAIAGLLASLLFVSLGEASIGTSSRISTNGLGALKIGMTLEEAEEAVGRQLKVSYLNSRECGSANVSARLNVSILLTYDVVARIYTAHRKLRTTRGIHRGSTIAEIKEAYPGARKRKHFYTGKPQYEYRVPGRKIIMETDGEQVTAISTGRLPEVNYVEGCA
jgi:hypothetical protein